MQQLRHNPTDGSRWMVKVQPTCNRIGVIPPTAVGGWLKSNLRRRRRLDLNHPPTAVGGIRGKEGRYVGWTLTIHRLPSVGFATIHCCIYFSKTINPRLKSHCRSATQKMSL